MRKLQMENLEGREMMASGRGDWHPRLPQSPPAAPALASSPSSIAAPLVAALSRDPALWPFASDSPWNMPIGPSAQYATISGGFNPNGGANLNVNAWSIPIYFAKDTDPLISIYWGGGYQGSVRIPAGAQPDSQGDASMAVISPDRQTVAEFIGMRWTNSTRIDADVAVINSLADQGVYPSYHGARAYGGSQIAGLIRKDELAAAHIPHALAVAVDPTSLNRNAPGGKTFVWPANSSDGGNGQGYGSDGNLYMGSLLAIPPSVNVASLGLSAQGLAVARALQDYGAYIVDRGGGNVIYYAEPGSSVSTSGSELGRLSQYLRVVPNNSATNVGGGGTPRVSLAPPFGSSVPVPTPDPNPSPTPDPDPTPNPPPTQVFDITGTVTNSGRAVSGAVVHLFDGDGNWLARTTTDSRGRYRFNDRAAGRYDVAVANVAGREWTASGIFTLSGDVTKDFSFTTSTRRRWWWWR